MAAVRLNVAANFIGRIWTIALGFVFIPVYLRFLGIEAYGLVGFFATLQAVFGLLDLGLGGTINREMARLGALGRRAEQRNLLRTLEFVYWGVSLAIGCVVILLAQVIATRWVNPEDLSSGSIAGAIRLMGVVIALQFPWGFYQGGLMGLGRQVLVNGSMVVAGTLRSAGAAVVLWQVAPTVEAFFTWQAFVSLVQTAWFATVVWRAVSGDTPPRFEAALLRAVWVFAAALAANAAIGSVLTQLDKVLLSRLLTLEQFGYYALAGTAASVVWLAIVPVNQALFPRFTELVQLGDEPVLAALYHRACQTLCVLVVPMAAAVAFFSFELIAAWTGNPLVAERTSLIVKLLIVGTTLNGLASLPGQLQTAAGWPQLVMYTNLVAAVLLVPALVFAATRFGAAGAAAVWVILNIGYLVFTVPIMHRRLLRDQLRRWYIRDLIVPGGTAVAIVAGLHAVGPTGLTGFGGVAYAGFAWLVAFVTSMATAPLVRTAVVQLLSDRPWPSTVWLRS